LKLGLNLGLRLGRVVIIEVDAHQGYARVRRESIFAALLALIGGADALHRILDVNLALAANGIREVLQAIWPPCTLLELMADRGNLTGPLT